MSHRGLDGYQINGEYMDAVRAVGGKPLVLPWAANQYEASLFMKGLRGILFTGGEDLHPDMYGRPQSERTQTGARRKSVSDMAYMRAALSENIPILGICLGMQELNVACGGTLIQHVAGHAGVDMKARFEGGILRKLYGKRHKVNHYHHQAVDALGRGLKVTATSGGLIEGIELPDHRWAVGVQWHPEALLDEDSSLGLFMAFIEEAMK